MQAPSVIASADLALIRDFVPGKEPILSRCKSGPRKSKVYSVAETSLRGNERVYLEGTFRPQIRGAICAAGGM
jgi:protein tyrosine phosphatase (PTP) superfamily phosphohydrolase (DUF442 family)